MPARIKLSRPGALALVVVLVGSLFSAAGPALGQGAPLVADFQFQNNFNSSVGSAVLQQTGTGATNFITEKMNRAPRTVLRYPQGRGLSLSTAGLITNPGVYSVAMLFRVEDANKYVRLIESKTSTENGPHIQGNRMVYYPTELTGGGTVDPHTYMQFVFTRDANGTVNGYLNGARVYSFQDSAGNSAIDAANTLKFFDDNSSDEAPGAVARIRVYNGVLTAEEAAALDDTPQPCNGDLLTRCDSEGATKVADYRFDQNLSSAVAGAPELVRNGAGAGDFITETVRRTQRQVFRFPRGSGLSMATRGLLESTSYSVALLFRFENTSSYGRVLDTQNGIEGGPYVNGGKAVFYPTVTGGGKVDPHTYVQYVITRDRNRNITGYIDGDQVYAFADTARLGLISEDDVLRFFKDNASDDPGGAVARIQVFDGPLAPQDVRALEDTPRPCNEDPVSRCAEGALLVADYRFDGNYESSVAPAPALTTIGVGTGQFVQDQIKGQNEQVLDFPDGSGLSLASTRGLLESNSYSVAINFRFDETTGYVRLLDTQNGIEGGPYVNSGEVVFYPLAQAGAGTVQPDKWVEFVMTRDRNRNVVGYLDGAQVFAVRDDGGLSLITEDDLLRFFKDNASDESGGAVDRIRLYNGPLTAKDVRDLDGAGVPAQACEDHPGAICGTQSGDDNIQGTAGDDVIVVGNGDNTVEAGDGDDLIIAGNGDNTLIAGGGDDEIRSGKGNDLIVSDAADSGSARRALAARGVTMVQTPTAVVGDDEVSSGGGNDEVISGGGVDKITTGGGKDEVDGGDDNDNIGGGDGNDVLAGGAGDDKLNGGPGKDKCFIGTRSRDNVKACEKVIKRNNM